MAHFDDDFGSTSWGTMTLERSGRHAADVAAARRHLDDVDMPSMPTYYRTPIRDFIGRYGWRAYALPVLLVITIVALATAGGAPRHKGSAASGTHSIAAPPVASPDISLKTDTPTAGANPNVLRASQLPAGGPYTVEGKGAFTVVKGTKAVFGNGPLHTYDIEVEDGITGIDLEQFARLVDTTLADRRSWSGHGVSLQRVDSGYADFHITLTSSMTVRKFCGYSIPVETSCYAAAGSVSDLSVNRVVFNVARWVRGAAAYLGDLNEYRVYMINHEDGHALGHMHAHECLANGLAPAMMQQTFGLRSATTGHMCGANPWPYPAGASDAPGAEQADTPQNDEYGLGD